MDLFPEAFAGGNRNGSYSSTKGLANLFGIGARFFSPFIGRVACVTLDMLSWWSLLWEMFHYCGSINTWFPDSAVIFLLHAPITARPVKKSFLCPCRASACRAVRLVVDITASTCLVFNIFEAQWFEPNSYWWKKFTAVLLLKKAEGSICSLVIVIPFPLIKPTWFECPLHHILFPFGKLNNYIYGWLGFTGKAKDNTGTRWRCTQVRQKHVVAISSKKWSGQNQTSWTGSYAYDLTSIWFTFDITVTRFESWPLLRSHTPCDQSLPHMRSWSGVLSDIIWSGSFSNLRAPIRLQIWKLWGPVLA